MSDLEERYGFAASVAERTDEQLVARFNGEVGNRAWGNQPSTMGVVLTAETSPTERRDFHNPNELASFSLSTCPHTM
jgi:hypothetical protein